MTHEQTEKPKVTLIVTTPVLYEAGFSSISGDIMHEYEGFLKPAKKDNKDFLSDGKYYEDTLLATQPESLEFLASDSPWIPKWDEVRIYFPKCDNEQFTFAQLKFVDALLHEKSYLWKDSKAKNVSLTKDGIYIFTSRDGIARQKYFPSEQKLGTQFRIDQDRISSLKDGKQMNVPEIVADTKYDNRNEFASAEVLPRVLRYVKR